MATGNSFKTELYDLYYYTQSSFISYPKELFIETLREFFSQYSYYHYSRDAWGYPNVTDHTNQLPDAGINDDSTTRLFIGESYHFGSTYYPSIIIKNSGARSVPISFTRDKYLIQWENLLLEDGYGNRRIIKQPAYYIQSGAWEGTISVDITTKNAPQARDDLIELVATLFIDTRFDELKDSGLLIKPGPSVGSPSETDEGGDKLYKCSINFDYRCEWHRKIPIKSTIDIINFCIDIGASKKIAPNLAIQFTI